MKGLTELLLQFGVAAGDLEKARQYQRKYGGQLEQIVISMGSMSAEVLPDFYARLLSLPRLSDEELDLWLSDYSHGGELQDLLLGYNWFLINVAGRSIVATPEPLNQMAAELLLSRGLEVELRVCTQEQLHKLRSQQQQQHEQAGEQLSTVEEARLRELASEAPTVNLLNSLITRALRQRASDMHIEPYQERAKARFRIDGVLQDAEVIPSHLVLPIITRLKILSQMDIAEKRRPQDGKIEMRISGTDLDIRVSALPLNDGESIVMRFLRKESIRFDMAVLGIAADLEQKIREDISKTAGVILLTGPTGSGKTTSLYTFLHQLNSPEVKIITLEDPVEYQLDGINQVQVNPDIGFDFAAGLRSIVRQDPDVIMLGEIRDKETAAIAMQSALTGHLVFSTVHTNDAPGAYTRLLDLGVEEFLLNAALISIVAQRLVRCLCPQCAAPDPAALDRYKYLDLPHVAQMFGIAAPDLRKAVGCEHCHHTGYRGRIAILEYLRCDEEIRALPKDENFISRARLLNKQRGGRDLLHDGLLKVLQGQTTLDEVLRVAG